MKAQQKSVIEIFQDVADRLVAKYGSLDNVPTTWTKTPIKPLAKEEIAQEGVLVPSTFLTVLNVLIITRFHPKRDDEGFMPLDT